MTDDSTQATGGSSPTLDIISIYLKDASFEAPNSPAILTAETHPKLSLQINTSGSRLKTNLYEVILNITVTAKDGDKTGFLVEIQQAGMFNISGFDDTQLAHVLGVPCPDILFPFAREEIANLVTKGGFPQLLLAPVNFDALFAQRQNQAATEPGEQALQ
ncbi:protein-export chaperone SecB [Pseudomonadota bacterium]